MKKDEIKKIWPIIVVICLLIVLLTTKFTFAFGSTTDWYNQHISIADYFRKVFFETGNLLPNLALNIGSGQNIFNLSYYNFLSPFTLLSYLFPFISTSLFYSIINILIVISSALLFYTWFRGFNSKSHTFLATILFTLATPLLFHAHRHFMFINYMPFLILGLIGVDKYFKDKHIWLITLSIFLITMTSFYYALPSALCLLLYFSYKKFNIGEKISKQDFKFIWAVFLGVLMASILTIPTLYTILNSRSVGNEINLLSLLIPSFKLDDFVISAYSFGLTAIFLFSLVYNLFVKDKKIKYLNIALLILLLIPIFTFVLNGFLYARAKILIPLLPLCFILIINFINDLENDKIAKKYLICISLFVTILSLVFQQNILFIIFLLVDALFVYYFMYSKNIKILYGSLIIVAFLTNALTSSYDSLITNQQLAKIHENENIAQGIKDDSYRISNLTNEKYGSNYVLNTNYKHINIYSSVYNKYYYDFIKNISNSAWGDQCFLAFNPTNNILLNSYLGVKYLISDSKYIPVGYKKNDNNIYINDNVLPIIYFNNQLISKDDYLKLNSKEKMEVLINNVVVNYGTNKKPNPHVFNKNITIARSEKSNNITVNKDNDKYVITSRGIGYLDISLNEYFQDEVIFLEFDMLNKNQCNEGGLSIKINDIKNTLSCESYLYYNNNGHFTYPLSFNEKTNQLHIEFSDGIFEIANLKVSSLDYENISNPPITKFNDLNMDVDKITGNIDVPSDGYIVVNIPYDEGFKVKLNNHEVDYELVNEAFIGIKVAKGYYHLEIEYTSPYLNIGIILSLIGIICYGIVIIKERKRKLL